MALVRDRTAKTPRYRGAVNSFVTVGAPEGSGWTCVDDGGRRRFIPGEALDPQIRDLRVGQRLRVEFSDDEIVAAELP